MKNLNGNRLAGEELQAKQKQIREREEGRLRIKRFFEENRVPIRTPLRPHIEKLKIAV